MTNILLKYLENRYDQKKPEEKISRNPGPVITISRLFGCPAIMCANDLADVLNDLEESKNKKWKVVSKEILDQAAKELGLSQDKIEFIFKFEKRNTVDEIIESLSSKYYKSERKIRNTIREVIRSVGEQGRVIIVGRGGAEILKDVPNSLHIKFMAPLDYRVKGVSKRRDISYNDAKKMTSDMDKKREELRKDMAGRTVELVDYDMVINCEKFKTNEVVDIIAKAAEIKRLI